MRCAPALGASRRLPSYGIVSCASAKRLTEILPAFLQSKRPRARPRRAPAASPWLSGLRLRERRDAQTCFGQLFSGGGGRWVRSSSQQREPIQRAQRSLCAPRRHPTAGIADDQTRRQSAREVGRSAFAGPQRLRIFARRKRASGQPAALSPPRGHRTIRMVKGGGCFRAHSAQARLRWRAAVRGWAAWDLRRARRLATEVPRLKRCQGTRDDGPSMWRAVRRGRGHWASGCSHSNIKGFERKGPSPVLQEKNAPGR